MKKIIIHVFLIGLFCIACVDKKKAQEEKEAAELNTQIETIDQEASANQEDLESLEKEAKAIDTAINELDNL